MSDAKNQDRDQTSRDFRKAWELHRMLFEEASDGLFITDPHARCVAVNPRATELTGFSHTELLGTTITDLLLPEGLVRSPIRMDEHLQGRIGSIRRKDGIMPQVEVGIRILPEGDLLVAVREMTEREQAGLSAILENTSDLVSTATPDAKLTYLNQAGRETAGWDREEPLDGRSIADLHPAWALHKIESEGLPAASETGHWEGETAILRRDGGEIPVSQVILAHRYPDGAVQFFSTIMRDISERKRAEMELRESEEKYRRLIETTGTGYVILDDQGRVIDANQEYMLLTGRQRLQEVVGHSVLDWTAPHDLERNAAEVRKCVEQGIVRNLEIDYITPTGLVKPVEINATLLRAPGALRILTLCRDITERKKAEKALRAHENLLSSVFRAAPIGIGVVSNRVLLAVNDRICEMIGCTQEELIGKSARVLYLSDADFEHVGSEKYRQINDRGTGTVETRWKCKDGRIIDVLLSSTPINPLDMAGGVTFTALDITGRKKAEEEKDQLQAQLLQAQKMESVGRLAGGVAHDFNNMLTVILGHAELAMKRCPPSEPLQADLKAIQKAAQRSADLTRQLLAFARKQTVAPKVLDLNDTVAGMLKTLLRRLIGEDIDLVWVPGGDLWQVRMDPSQIDQLLANLCINARDAISRVGKVTIETNNVVFDDAYCAGHTDFLPGEYVMLAVSDDGCGMEKEVIDHLFEPFFTTKELGKGIGLGLAIVYGIVKQNEGFISVCSEPEKGTTFRIYLPRFVGESVQDIDAEATETPVGRGETVLLVEDEATILTIGKEMLKSLDYRVLTAATPAEAILQAESSAGEIHLLVTDIILPEMNGRELANLLSLARPGLKCLFMSGYSADVIAHRGVMNEGVRFLQKPFSLHELAIKVREALEQ